MDQVKKKPGRKPKIEAAAVEAVSVAVAALPDAEAVRDAVLTGEPAGLPPAVSAAEVDLSAPQAPALPPPGEPEPDEVAFTIDIPAHLHDSAIPLHEFMQCPADIRGAIQSQLGCLFTLTNGRLTAKDGRLYTVRQVGHAIEVIRA